MINKIVQSMADALAGVKDGSVVLVGGFGSIGQPNALIAGLIEQGAKDLTIVANNSGVGHVGLAASPHSSRRVTSARSSAPSHARRIRSCSKHCGAKAVLSLNACRKVQ